VTQSCVFAHIHVEIEAFQSPHAHTSTQQAHSNTLLDITTFVIVSFVFALVADVDDVIVADVLPLSHIAISLHSTIIIS
jgi:hypothetical protein